MLKKKMLIAGKYCLYAGVILLLYVLQTTPGFLNIFGVKPLLVAPFAICIAVYEGEFIGGMLGALAGLLCDMGAYTFFGFYSITLFLYCVTVGLMIIYFMKNNVKNIILLCGIYVGVMGLIELVFYYALWGYAGWGTVLVFEIIPRTVYTCVTAVALWYLTGAIWSKFAEKTAV